ncbi:unnamed protein product [Amaranthus hypochondriacus]
MATGIVENLSSALQIIKELRELCSMFKYESELTQLEKSVETIKAVFLDAESKHQELNYQGKLWLSKLKDAVYDADDLFDKFTTVAEQLKRASGGKISKKIRRFFSSDNQLLFAANTSRKITMIRNKLDSIAKDRTQFGFNDLYIRVNRRDETFSYVHEPSIIGRDADREAIMDLLLKELDSSIVEVENNISFVTIVGIGGLGKTTLAQMVFNDERIKSAFELSFWVCVSENFGIEEILAKMLGKSELSVEQLNREARRRIEGKRYFLVLDDVWSESRNEWAKLREYLLLGATGSRVIVTSRSKKVARALGDDLMYELRGLSDEDSWRLFKRISFNQNSRQDVDLDLVEIGKDIVKKCANVPLSIRVIGSMLYEQDKSKWRIFREMDLAKMGEGEEGIMSILKFSYFHLTPQLKSCFSYCALFPKDYKIDKEMLINLWSAHGCLKPLNDSRSIDDVGDECFNILYQRCFFQDITWDQLGEIKSCKMHDLIHDLALHVAGKEMCLMLGTNISPFDKTTRHLSVIVQRSLLFSLIGDSDKIKRLRTFFRPHPCSISASESLVSTLLDNCRRLRVLSLSWFGMRVVPNKLSYLSHLRYLDLSFNGSIKTLPKTITKLHHLQVLRLQNCWQLRELPDDLFKLVDLKHLDITGCFKLGHMPVKMDSLTRLCKLTTFVLAGGSSKQAHVGQLRDLIPLTNLRGKLHIVFREGYVYDTTSTKEGAYLLNKEHVKILKIVDEGLDRGRDPKIVDKRLLDRLEPHSDLMKISIKGYTGIEMPGWGGTLGICFPLLVNVTLKHFPKLHHLPPLSRLQHLKYLELGHMFSLEYIDDGDNGSVVPSFPMLQELILDNLPNMKSFPGCPHVKRFTLCGFNESFTFCRRMIDATASATASASSTLCSNRVVDNVFDLEFLCIDRAKSITSLFGASLQSIRRLKLINLEVEDLSGVGQVYQRLASSIQFLCFADCHNLKSLSGIGIEHLCNLKELTIRHCRNLEWEKEEVLPWKDLHFLPYLVLENNNHMETLPIGLKYLTSLRALDITSCRKLEMFPEGLQRLASIQKLRIRNCCKCKSLPESILPFLTILHINNCKLLKERYGEPNGTDWSKVSHIPDLVIK